MQEDTEAFNENSNSEVIILPQNSHLDETLISDDDDVESETPHSYDAKLNAKLKDLGLYEDGMTIQQKEELLAVVAVSFKTAEEEKTRRQWYEDYNNAALAFPEDEIEFSFRQSPESELSTKVSSYSEEFNTNSIKTKGNSTDTDKKIASRSSVAGGSSDVQSSSDFQSLPSTSQGSGCKPKSHSRRVRSRGTGSAFKLSLEEGNTVTSHSEGLNYEDSQLTTNQRKKHLLEKSMSSWRPCLSPKDEPLTCSSRERPGDLDESCLESESNKKMFDFLQDFSFALTEIKKSSRNRSRLAKPYHLTRGGHCLRKATKLDSLDIMVGVQEGREETFNEGVISNCRTIKKEPFSRTSGGAFRYAQLHRDRIDALRSNSTAVSNHSSGLTTRSGSRYGYKKVAMRSSVEEECRTPPEIIIEDGSETSDICMPDGYDSNSLHRKSTSDRQNSEVVVKNVTDTKLPKFSNLRPDLCRDRHSAKEALSKPLPYSGCSTSNCTEGSKSLGTTYRRDNHIDLSFPEADLSDGSSVIDVETIVDDEIEEFVLKRKLLQEPTISDKQTYSNRSKRLRKKSS